MKLKDFKDPEDSRGVRVRIIEELEDRKGKKGWGKWNPRRRHYPISVKFDDGDFGIYEPWELKPVEDK